MRPTDKEFHTDDLINQITIGYSAVDDVLKIMELEQLSSESAATLASVARVLHRQATERVTGIIAEVVKKTGGIEVLTDTSLHYTAFDVPIKGIIVHPKEENSNA